MNNSLTLAGRGELPRGPTQLVDNEVRQEPSHLIIRGTVMQRLPGPTHTKRFVEERSLSEVTAGPGWVSEGQRSRLTR